MSVIVGHAEEVGWLGDDAVTQIDEYGPRAIKHRNLLRAALLLLGSGHPWTPELKALWPTLTGDQEISGRALCGAIRASGISIDELLR
jgi:hypothetical protein